MNRRITFLLLFLLLGLNTTAQLTENAWVKSNQKYLKITVNEDGIYQVTGQELTNAGFSLATAIPQKIQLFYRGKEVAIKLKVNNDNRFELTDSFFFYGQKNDGSRDSLLYRNTERANPFHSLYTDESAYFLTIGEEAGKRIATEKSINSTNLLEEPYHLVEERTVFTDQFSYNNIIGLVPLLQQSYFENGEGRTGKFIVSDTTAYFNIRLKNRVEIPDVQPIINFQINGRSRIVHQLATSVNGQDSAFFSVSPFGTAKRTHVLGTNLIQNESVRLSLSATQKVPLDWYSMTYIEAVYPQQFLIDGQNFKYFYLRQNRPENTSVFIRDLSESGLLWNVTHAGNPVELLANTEQKFVVEASSNNTKLLAVQASKTALKIEAVDLINVSNSKADYLIITHESLLESATKYAAYRASDKGGSHSPLIVTSQQLFNAFNYGERSPIALRQFADFMLQNAQPKHLLIIGRGVSFPDELRSTRFPDLVPTIGYPASDVLITAGLNGNVENVQAIPTGRLNVVNNIEVLNYLEKVKETESRINPELWQKDILHLSGGQNPSEIRSLRSILGNVAPSVGSSFLGGKVTAFSKQTNLEIEPIDISKEVNAGLGMITFAGHGSANEIDLNIGYCSPPQNGFNNKGKYPVMFFNGCGVGNIFYRYNALSTDWLLTPDKGAIVVFANSFWSYAYPTQRYLDVLYEKLFVDSSTVTLTIGQIQQTTNLQLSAEDRNDFIKANIHQVILQGDPALRLFPMQNPDYQVTERSIFIKSVNESRPIAENDSLNVGIIIQNNGRFVNGKPVSVSVKQLLQNNTERLKIATINAVAYQDTVYVKIKKDATVKQLTVVIDGENNTDEYNESNNEATLKLENWDEINTRTSFPDNTLPDLLPPVLRVLIDNKLIANNGFVAKSPTINLELTDNESLDSVSNYHFDVLLQACESCEYERVNLTQQRNEATLSTKFPLNVPLNNLQARTYGLRINAKDYAGNLLANPYEIQFNVVERELPSTLTVFPNPGNDFVQIRYVIVAFSEPTASNIVVYNTSGKQMFEAEQQPKIGENNYFVDTKTFAAGRYFAKVIINGTEIISAPFIVE